MLAIKSAYIYMHQISLTAQLHLVSTCMEVRISTRLCKLLMLIKFIAKSINRLSIANRFHVGKHNMKNYYNCFIHYLKFLQISCYYNYVELLHLF